ncbi:hypothetical protein ACOBQB_21470 [Streptomyces sp. G5(2025)]|uniref:hypothetical protein n=1 Tax=Streptomyces sp. G5(2025) TaxID=3406628 RepID=UPI003C16CE4B
MNEFMAEAGGYIAIQSTRPRTRIVDKLRDMTSLEKELPHEAVDRDTLLTNVTIYWLTGTAASSAAFSHEEAAARGEQEPMSVPLGVAQFTVQDIALRRDEEKVNNVVRWRDYDRGGHFAALEAPALLLTEIREFFADYR